MKALEKLFERQSHKKHMIVQDGKPDEELRIGFVRYGVRMTKAEYDIRFPHLPRKADASGCIYIVTTANRHYLRRLKKSHLFEKFTGSGWPIFQTKDWIKTQELFDDCVVIYGA